MFLCYLVFTDVNCIQARVEETAKSGVTSTRPNQTEDQKEAKALERATDN